MFVWVAQWTIISLVLICLLHYLYFFLIDTLTVPKIRDLIHKPLERYNEISSLTCKEPPLDDMHNELRQFLSNISSKDTVDTTPLANETAKAEYSKF